MLLFWQTCLCINLFLIFFNNINIACWWERCSANHSVWRSPISKTQQLASPIGQAPSYWAAWHTQFFLSIRQYQYKLSFYNYVSTPNNNAWNIFILFDSYEELCISTNWNTHWHRVKELTKSAGTQKHNVLTLNFQVDSVQL